MGAEPPPTALDVLPRPAPGMVALALALLALAAAVLVLMAAVAGDALTRGAMGPAARAGGGMVMAGMAMALLMRWLRRLRDPRPVLVIRPEGLTLPRHGPKGAPVRLRWNEIEVISWLGETPDFPRLHLGLSAEASRARGVFVPHLPEDAPHIGNRLRFRQPLGGLSEPPARIQAALFAAAEAAGIRFSPTPAPLAQRMVEGGPGIFPRWTRMSP